MKGQETVFGRNYNPLGLDLLQIIQPGDVVVWRLLQSAAVWFAASGTPGTITGQLNGNLYLDIVSGDIWQLQNGTWIQINSGNGSPARLSVTGTRLHASDFTLSGWGSGAAMTSVVGSDGAHSFTITAGTGPSIDPTVGLVYIDGPWPNAPVITGQMIGGSGSFAFLSFSSATSGYVLTFNGLPVASASYVFSVQEIGI